MSRSERKIEGPRGASRALAPFGRLGHRLGFRWIMPIGTLPLPFHPGLARLLPWLVPAFVLHRIVVVAAGGSGGATWSSLLIAAASLAVPLTIPIVNWLAMALRLPLLQGLLFAGAMLLLGLDAATGAAPAWAGAVPAAFAALYLAQRFGGPIYLRRLQAANATFAPASPDGRLVVVAGRGATSSYVASLIFKREPVARVSVERDRRARKGTTTSWHRLLPEDAAAIGERLKLLRPPGWRLDGTRLETPGTADPGAEPPIRITFGKHRAPLWLVAGKRTALEIDDGRTVQRLVGGEAAIVGRLPLFLFFYWGALFGGRSQWIAGFPREKPVSLGATGVDGMLASAFPPPLDDRPPPADEAAPLLAELDAIDAAQQEEARVLLDRLLDPGAELPKHWSALGKRPDVAFGRGPALCACLAAAKEAKRERAVRMAAELISTLPGPEFQRLAPELLSLLNSKALGFRLLSTDDPAVLALPERERLKYVSGGFSLVRRVPRLYARLGELGEAARPLIVGLGTIGDWPAPLVQARSRLDRGAKGDSHP